MKAIDGIFIGEESTFMILSHLIELQIIADRKNKLSERVLYRMLKSIRISLMYRQCYVCHDLKRGRRMKELEYYWGI